MRRSRRTQAVVTPGVRRTAPLARPRPAKQPAQLPRHRSRRLRLVVVNARPRRRRTPLAKPSLRLLHGNAPRLAMPRQVVPRPRTRPNNGEARSRVAQLVFVVAMAAVGLAALATSVGQILARGM